MMGFLGDLMKISRNPWSSHQVVGFAWTPPSTLGQGVPTLVFHGTVRLRTRQVILQVQVIWQALPPRFRANLDFAPEIRFPAKVPHQKIYSTPPQKRDQIFIAEPIHRTVPSHKGFSGGKKASLVGGSFSFMSRTRM